MFFKSLAKYYNFIVYDDDGYMQLVYDGVFDIEVVVEHANFVVLMMVAFSEYNSKHDLHSTHSYCGGESIFIYL